MQFSMEGNNWDPQIEALMARLSPDKVNAASARALNRAATSALAAIDGSVAKDLKLTVGDVRSQIEIIPATPERLIVRVAPARKQIPLVKFGARGPQPSRGRGKVTADTGQGRKTYEGAFIATMKSGHRGVFRRVGGGMRKSRGAWSMNLPIVELKGPSIAWAFKKYRTVGMEAGASSLKKNLLSELRFRARENA